MCMKGLGWMIRLKEKGCIGTLQVQCMMESGTVISRRVMEWRLGQMVRSTKVSIKMGRNMGRANFTLLMVRYMKEYSTRTT